MKCEECRDRLSAYVDGELPAEERAAVEAHAAGCPECAAALSEIRALDTVTKQSVELTMPGKDFARRVMGELPPMRRFWDRWQGPVVFAVVALITAVILAAVKRYGGPPRPDGSMPDKDLGQEITVLMGGAERKLRTPATVEAAHEGEAAGVVLLPHKAAAVFSGSVEVGSTKAGVTLKPKGKAAIFVSAEEIALRDAMVVLPDGRVAGYGKAFAVVAGPRNEWRVFAITGTTRVAERSGEKTVEARAMRALTPGAQEAVEFTGEEIASVLRPLADALPLRPVLPYAAYSPGVFSPLLTTRSGLDPARAEKTAGVGEVVAAMSVLGPKRRAVISLTRQGDKWDMVQGAERKTVEMPEGEIPAALVASPELGPIVLTRSGHLFRIETAAADKKNALHKTEIGDLKHVAWDAWGGGLFIAGPGGVASLGTAYFATIWHERKLRDVAGMTIAPDRNLVIASSDGAIAFLSRYDGKPAAVYGPVGQAFALPPVCDSGKVYGLGQGGRLVEIRGGESTFRDVPELAGAEAWGVKGDYVYFRKQASWFRYSMNEQRVAPEGVGGSWAILDMFGLVRCAEKGLYRGNEQIAEAGAGSVPVMTPHGLAMPGAGVFIPFKVME